MESLLARALESKLKYWLKSFTRDQFKLQGRTVQLCNLDINGEALHSSMGLPATLTVSQARVGRLEIKVPPFANVQTEPVVVEIDKLDLVLLEKGGSDTDASSNISQGSSTTAKGTGYGYADKIADGMTLQVGTVNLMLETHGGTTGQKGAAWTPPLAAVTIHNLLLYTTNEHWKVVNLKDARDFSANQKCIFVFKKLEWDSMSIDLLPHPDMFSDEALTSPGKKESKLEKDGAKRLFFGGERFLDNISGKAHITMHRTEHNNPLGLEVQVHIPEAVCAALSEPGLRALLRFMTGMYVCMNRGDVDPKSSQSRTEAAERSTVAATVDHIFLCIKDADFQLELLMQDLQYARSSVTDGNSTQTLARISVGGFFLRDTFQYPGSTLVQPGIHGNFCEPLPVPNFANERLWPRIYPLSNETYSRAAAPFLCMYSVQMVPSPLPPSLASQTVVQCQPLKINLQEGSFLRIASFLVDGVVVERGVVTPTTSVDSMYLTLKQLDLTLPVDVTKAVVDFQDIFSNNEFFGISFHAEEFVFVQSPTLNFKVLDLEKDPACFMLWPGQPVDASQRKWVMRSLHLSVALETGSHASIPQDTMNPEWLARIWRCIEITELCFEAAMVTGDGCPLVSVPPPGGIVRFGLHCKQLTSNISVEQLFFVLRMYEHLGKVYESLLRVTKATERGGFSKNSSLKKAGSFANILEVAPSDTAVKLGLDFLKLKFLESLSKKCNSQGPPLVQFSGNGINLSVSHRTLGGAIAIASRLYWLDVQVECVETDWLSVPGQHDQVHLNGNQCSMKRVFWTCNGQNDGEASPEYQPPSTFLKEDLHFLDINVINVIPYRPEDAECHSLTVNAKFCGGRLGGGMSYSEALLHCFGILRANGEPGEGLIKVIRGLSNGPLASLLKPPSQVICNSSLDEISSDDTQDRELGSPDEIEVNIQLQDWVFALEGFDHDWEIEGLKEERCWHSAFQSLHVTAQGGCDNTRNETSRLHIQHPVQKIAVEIQGLEFIKPCPPPSVPADSMKPLLLTKSAQIDLPKRATSLEDRRAHYGLDIEMVFALRDKDAEANVETRQWDIESIKAGIKKPVEVKATKQEVEYLIESCRIEVEAAGRLVAGLMRLAQLQGSIGQAAIEQLSSMGSGSLEKLLSMEKPGRRSSIGSVASVSSLNGKGDGKPRAKSDMSKLEGAILSSQSICAALNRRFTESSSSSRAEVTSELASLTQQLDAVRELAEEFSRAAQM